MGMMTGLLLWGGCYATFALVFPFLSVPGHKLCGYLTFEAVCLFPWLLWLLWLTARKDRTTGIAMVVQACAVLAVTYPTHIVTTHKLFWTYFEHKDVLLGVRIGGVPIEEYFFYPLTINFSILLYVLVCDYLRAHRIPDIRIDRKVLRGVLGFLALVSFGAAAYVLVFLRDPANVVAATETWDAVGVPHYAEGPRDYGWTLVCLSSMGFNFILLYLAELYTPMMLRAVLAIVPVFFLVCLLVDQIGVSRGWWVFNDQQCSGLWVAGVPVEDLGMYLTGVMLPIALFEATRRLLGARSHL